jgi:hypothetical protein
MAVAGRPGEGYLGRPQPSGLADVIEVILDKGLVIDAYVRISLIGIELITIDARIVIASVDTYLRRGRQPARPRRGRRRRPARAAGNRTRTGLQGGHQGCDRGHQGGPGHRQIGRHPRARLA